MFTQISKTEVYCGLLSSLAQQKTYLHFPGLIWSLSGLVHRAFDVHANYLCSHSSCADNTAALLVKEGPFNLEDSSDYSVEVRISDGGQPLMSSVTKLQIKVLTCFALNERGMPNMFSEAVGNRKNQTLLSFVSVMPV